MTIATDNTNYGVSFRAPAIPYAPAEYDQQAIEQINSVLRLYFAQLDTAVRNASTSDRAEAIGWFFS